MALDGPTHFYIEIIVVHKIHVLLANRKRKSALCLLLGKINAHLVLEN